MTIIPLTVPLRLNVYNVPPVVNVPEALIVQVEGAGVWPLPLVLVDDVVIVPVGPVTMVVVLTDEGTKMPVPPPVKLR